MILEPYGQRKTELLAVVEPETGAAIRMPYVRAPPSFAARIVLPHAHSDLIIYDDRIPHKVFPRLGGSPREPFTYERMIQREPLAYERVIQHQYRVRTEVHLDLNDARHERERDYILRDLHASIFDGLRDLIVSTVDGKPTHAPYSVSLWRRKNVTKHTSDDWLPHTGVKRELLLEALLQGTERIAASIWQAHAERYGATGLLSPSNS